MVTTFLDYFFFAHFRYHVDDTDPLLTVNSVTVDLTNPSVRVVPGVADPTKSVQSIPDMAAPNPKLIAGVNGGYFWRVDVSGIWVDDVCRGKTRNDAEQPASPIYPNYGVGDGIVRIDNVTYANNCNCSGFSRPATLKIPVDPEDMNIEVLHRGEYLDESIPSAIAAGPNLVSYNATTLNGYIDIPSDDDNINRFEHAANTAVGLYYKTAKPNSPTQKADKFILVTTDGSDECGIREKYCGLNTRFLASLMKNHFDVSEAMSMDQGGSTTMWIKGVNPDRNGVVSRSHNTEPVEQDGPRSVANGLFLELL